MSRRPLWFAIAVASVALLAAWAVLCVPYLPTNDGPQHILSGVMQNHYDDPGSVYPRAVILQSQYAEHGFSLLFLPLEELFGWRRATQLFLVVLVELTGFGVLFLATGVGKRRGGAGLLGFALAFTWPLYMGFFPFAFTIAIGLFVLGLELRRRSARATIAIGLLLALMAFMHVVAAALVGIALAILRLSREPHRRSLITLALSAVVPVAVFLAAASGHSDVTNGEIPLRFVSVWERVATLPRLCAPGSLVRAVAILAFSVVAATYAIRRRDERGLALIVLLFLVIGAISPADIRGWQFFAPRWLILPILLAPALLAVERHELTFGLTALSLFLTARLHRQLHEGCASVYGAVNESLPVARFELGLTLEDHCGVAARPHVSEVPYLGALTHAGALFSAAHRSFQPFMFHGSASTYAFRLRPDSGVPPAPPNALLELTRADDLPERDALLRTLAAFGRAHDRMSIIGATHEELDLFVAAGFTPELRSDRLLLARFRGCSVRVLLPAEGMTVELGARGVAPPLAGGFVKGREVTLPKLLCGPGWLRVLRPDRSPGCQQDITVVDGARVSCQ